VVKKINNFPNLQSEILNTRSVCIRDSCFKFIQSLSLIQVSNSRDEPQTPDLRTSSSPEKGGKASLMSALAERNQQLALDLSLS